MGGEGEFSKASDGEGEGALDSRVGGEEPVGSSVSVG